MRASSLVLGPLVARTGHARVAMPGGFAIGGRPIDLHIKGLETMGATITYEHGYIEARAERLKGAYINFDKITVTGTEDLLMAAVLAEGETLMENCAREPEVTDLAAMLTAMGAKIEGAGTSVIRVRGVDKLHGMRHRINPDRIEAGTFLIAGAITGGDLCVANCCPAHLGAVIGKLEECGVRVDAVGKDALRVRSEGPLKAVVPKLIALGRRRVVGPCLPSAGPKNFRGGARVDVLATGEACRAAPGCRRHGRANAVRSASSRR